MITYLIIDDEYLAHEVIKDYCDMLPNMQLQKNCYNALEALEYLSNHSVDLIFLDLNMPKLKGFDFLKTLSAPPKVIVTTAYSEFALEGYELNVVDYLLKPFSFERFLKAVNKAIGGAKPSSKASISTAVEERLKAIFLRENKKYVQVVIDDIQYVESSGNYVKVIAGTETITVRDKISGLLEMLPDTEFIQVHKSFAIAIKHIKSVQGNRIFLGEHIIPIGKVYKMKVNELLG
ncbi:MAG: response regulator transcription factor [Balneolaceae bacterium]|nr:response regulator transcription factor [Balneolaceae bacterium]MBO6545948.1 response regulator transcription factor [Balneolaceae bacterium]MBO6647344.1 response regulator transcription factor [Balneolaceae bacterium]